MTRRPTSELIAGLVPLLWQQPLWAVPFAVFFGTVYGATPGSYWISYQVSLIFAFAVRFAIWIVWGFVEPRCVEPGKPPEFDLRMGAAYAIAAVAGAGIGALIAHFTVMPGMLGSTRAVIVTALFTLVFVGLFTGINLAIVFYRRAVERARAVEQTRAALAEAELRALRAQIHPHFLFNTLNTIASLIATDPAAAEDTTTRLADLFRYVLAGAGRDHAPLGDELAFLRTYLAIERLRAPDRIAVRERIEPGLERIPVPSLLLQPLVENAVRHGLAGSTAGGTLTLTARRDGDRLAIEVADDGPGLDPAAVETADGFGLRSVRERLRLAGPPHALEIDSAPGRGTRVRITLPVAPRGADAAPLTPGGRP
jgi:sensor histidine kinase YesM